MDDLLVKIIQVVAYIAPYFLIPATFKAGMGVFGNLVGMVNDRSRGIFDRQRKFREGQKQKYRQRAREGNRFAGGTSTNWRGRMNRGIGAGMTAPGAILNSGSTFKPQNWRAATRTATQSAAMTEVERNLKENQAYQSWMHDDGLNKIASETSNESELRAALTRNGYQGASLNDAVSRVESVRRSMGADSFRAMTTRQALAGGTAYNTAGEAWEAVARAAGNDDAMASYLVANGRSEGSKAGRIDYGGAGFGTTLTQVNKMREELNRTGTVSAATREMANAEIHKDVFEGQGGASLVHSSMKKSAVQEMAPEMVRYVENSRILGDDRQFAQSLASLAAVYDGMQGSSPAKAEVIANEVMSHTINVGELTPEMRARLGSAIDTYTTDSSGNRVLSSQKYKITLQQAIDAMRSDTEFKEMRREYANEVDRVRGAGVPEPNQPPGQLPGIQ